ncbi:DsbA family protein [Gaiella sp.]|uniref:DsbA family protein n=1 Tax=Gaiella sp. TaxID=2663207 RepID=UPI003983B75C
MPRSRLGLTLAAAALALAVVTTVGASPGTDLVQGIPQRGTVIGERTANVTLIQFEDLACTHCNTYMKLAFPTIVNDYVRPGLVKVDFRGLGIVTRASEPALRFVLAAGRQRKLWQMTEVFYENQAKLNEIATDKGVRRLARGIPGLDANQLILDSKSLSVRKQAAAHAVEADRRKVPGTPWFFIKVGTNAPKLVRPTAYSGEAFATLLDEALGR